MPIVNELIYEPIISRLNSEKDILILLEDVRNELGLLCNGSILNETLKDFSKKPLREIVSVIDEGYLTIPQDRTSERIDLSKARYLLQNYKFLSERGCQSCKSLETFKPLSDETGKYCGLSETIGDVSERDMSSPRVSEYFEKGCDERAPVFRPLENVLAEAV